MTGKELREIEAREKAATPGPWHYMTRDPRVDPRPGDVVRGDLGREWRVAAQRDGDVYFNVYSVTGYCMCTERFTLSDWRDVCANAEIVKVSP